MKRLGVLVGLLSVIASACADSAKDGAGLFRLVSIDGNVRVRHDGDWSPAEEDTELARGDEVSVGSKGSVKIALPGGGTIELGKLARLALTSPQEPELLKGSLLADARRPFKLKAKGFSVEAERGSVVRVDLFFGHRVGVYDGEVMVPGSGWSNSVAELSQLDIVGGIATSGPTPLRIDADDPWDLRMLGEALDVGAALDQKETGLRAQLQGEAARIALDKVLGSWVTPEERAALLAEFVPEAVLVAAIIAREIGRDPTADVLTEILSLRDGAGWEIVAGRWEVARSVLQKIGVLAGEVLEQVRRETPRVTNTPPRSSGRARATSSGGGGSSSGSSSSSRSGGGGGGGG
ncbi:MAG TPA: hypothetical protein VEA19_07855, partial [Actinomycetota bacterium]|nr:hypothetical protein [Actinomycetota bacterium]